MNSMLTLEEVKSFLETDQKKIESYIKDQKLHAYKIGGTYLRFRKEEVINLRTELFPAQKKKTSASATFFSKVSDFWRFNNFYIVSVLLIAGLAYYIIKT